MKDEQKKISDKSDIEKKDFEEIKFDEFIWPWFTPKWFEFLSWILMISLFLGLFKKTQNGYILIIYTLSNMFLVSYLSVKINKFLINLKLFFYKRKSRLFFTFITSLIFIIIINFFLNKVIDQIITHVNQYN